VLLSRQAKFFPQSPNYLPKAAAPGKRRENPTPFWVKELTGRFLSFFERDRANNLGPLEDMQLLLLASISVLANLLGVVFFFFFFFLGKRKREAAGKPDLAWAEHLALLEKKIAQAHVERGELIESLKHKQEELSKCQTRPKEDVETIQALADGANTKWKELEKATNCFLAGTANSQINSLATLVSLSLSLSLRVNSDG